MSDLNRITDLEEWIGALKYMDRFGCIGPDCEDNCCYGWRVGVDNNTYKKLEYATSGLPEERKRLRGAVTRRFKTHKSRRYATYSIELLPHELCPMLEKDGLCHIHKLFGEALLPDVCATYPRKINQIGNRRELVGMISCPEVARQLLLPEDAIDYVKLPQERLPRQMLADVVDLRDIRPLWRLQDDVRTFILDTLRRRELSAELRLFYITYFAHRTADLLNKAVSGGHEEPVRREMAKMKNPKLLAELSRRLKGVETPSAMALIVARELIRPGMPSRTRSTYLDLVEGVLDTYKELRQLLPDDDEPDRSVTEAVDEESRGEVPETAEDDSGQPTSEPAAPNTQPAQAEQVNIFQVWRDYQQRKARIMERAGARVDQYMTHFAAYYFFNRPNREAPDLLTHTLRMLTEMSTFKFLIFGHPRMLAAIQAPKMSDEEFQTTLDEVAVEVFYRVGRFIEHSSLLQHLERALEHRDMRSLAGAVYLIRF